MFLRVRHHVGAFTRSLSSLPVPPSLSAVQTPGDTRNAREWVEVFRQREIPRNLVQLSFARSSGPGGQNVNKVNTKATVRCPVESAWIPLWAREAIQKSPYFVASTNTILITSSAHRSQSQNIEECLSKLHNLVLTSAMTQIKNETPETQKARIASLEKSAKERNRRMKDARSAIKKARKGAARGWD